MSLVRFEPFRNFNTLSRRMNSLINEFDTDAVFNTHRGFHPTVDVQEDEKYVTIEAEIPGVKKEDINVSINDENILVLKGTKNREAKSEDEKDGATFLRVERSFGEFTRSFVLPDNINTEKIDAEFKDGLLRVKLEKKEPEKPKEIKVAIN
jgi:HSP20 family protein